MSNDFPDPWWDWFDGAFRASAELAAELDPDPKTARQTVLFLIDDGNYPLALVFAAAAVRHSDGRPAALQLAELLVPRIELMLDRPHEPEFESTMEVDEAVAAYEEIIRRLRSVIDAARAGRPLPPAFRDDVEAWWDGLVAGGDIDEAIEAAKRKYGESEEREHERFWFHEILLDWLYVDDQWRWQAALVLLTDARVARAADEMRSAAGYAVDEKAPFADTFRRYADELDQATDSSG